VAEAGRRVAAARVLAERQALGEHWVTVMVDYAAGELARLRGEPQLARAEIEHGLNVARQGGLRLDTVYGLLALTQIAPEQSGPAAAGADELSERELAILRLLASQLSLREIDNELYISLNTIKTHIRSIYAKLRVASREQALARAREFGLLSRSTLAQR